MTTPDSPRVNADNLGNPLDSAVVAIVPEGERQACTEALLAAGVEENFFDVLIGEEGRQILDADAKHHGAKKRFLHVLQSLLGSSGNDTYAYDTALADGDAVIAVDVADDEQMRAVVTILRDHGGERINYFSGGTEVQL